MKYQTEIVVLSFLLVNTEKILTLLNIKYYLNIKILDILVH